MRISKLNTPLLALIFAAVFEALLAVLAFAPKVVPDVFDRFLSAFFTPAIALTILCLPSVDMFKGSGYAAFISVLSIFVLLQLFLLIWVSISLYRHFLRKRV